MWTPERYFAATAERMRETERLRARNRKQAEREAVIASCFRWLSMARADFPELGARLPDARLREIAVVAADMFLGGE